MQTSTDEISAPLQTAITLVGELRRLLENASSLPTLLDTVDELEIHIKAAVGNLRPPRWIFRQPPKHLPWTT